MRSFALMALFCAIQMNARADFSYESTRKSTAGAANGTSKTWFKGQKMKTEDGDTASLIDFEAQTITTISNARKTFTVRNFSDVTAGSPTGATITADSKETGQHKTINGFDARELVMTMQIEMPQGRGQRGKMEMEIDLWISRDVPGAQELRAFYQKNAGKFPWNAMAGGNNTGIQSAMAEMQKKIASMDGVQVEQVIRMKQAGGAPAQTQVPQMTPAQAAQMDQARARLEAMQAQGGPQAAMAQQALARMGSIAGGRGASAPGNGALMEMTVDSADFSTASVPDSVFAIPAGYQKTDVR